MAGSVRCSKKVSKLALLNHTILGPFCRNEKMSDLTLVIGNKNYSSWSLRPWLFLKHVGVPFEEVRDSSQHP